MMDAVLDGKCKDFLTEIIITWFVSSLSTGRTEEDMFSSSLYRFHLGDRAWAMVQPFGGKPPATAGHSMVFHTLSRTLLVYGGHRPTTARYNMLTYLLNSWKVQNVNNKIRWSKISFISSRFSVRVNSTDIYHVDRRVWTSLRSRYPAHGPRERAFHSATIIGNYMVVFGKGSSSYCLIMLEF